MNNSQIVFVLFLILISYYYLMTRQNEGYTGIGYGPFKPIDDTPLVDPLVCYPGTYWRNGTYYDSCKKMLSPKMRMGVDGKPFREPEAKYKMVCSPDEHLNRNCQFVKVYDKFF
jgi:hypothetical protein